MKNVLLDFLFFLVNLFDDGYINSEIHFLSLDSRTGSTARRPGVISHPAGHLPQHAAGTLSVLCT